MTMHRRSVLLQFLISRLQRRRLNPPSASSSSSLPPPTTTLHEMKNIPVSEITLTPLILSRKSSRMMTIMHLCLCVCAAVCNGSSREWSCSADG